MNKDKKVKNQFEKLNSQFKLYHFHHLFALCTFKEYDDFGSENCIYVPSM
jgi:hypothetical protein